jgi:hypothetical protein
MQKEHKGPVAIKASEILIGHFLSSNAFAKAN